MEKFINSLKTQKTNAVFNPWFDHDHGNDIDNKAPQQRLKNLKLYLDERINAEYLLVAEALGYQGGHFTGIPMTSERIILGDKSVVGILPNHVCDSTLLRTSNKKIHKDGFNEPTATIVWGKLIAEKLNTKNFVFWNAFPWHPYKSSGDLLTNRTPNNSEMKDGEVVLKALLKSFNFKKIIALGNKAHNTLGRLGIDAVKVRHPAMGGAELFRKQFVQVL